MHNLELVATPMVDYVSLLPEPHFLQFMHACMFLPLCAGTVSFGRWGILWVSLLPPPPDAGGASSWRYSMDNIGSGPVMLHGRVFHRYASQSCITWLTTGQLSDSYLSLLPLYLFPVLPFLPSRLFFLFLPHFPICFVSDPSRVPSHRCQFGLKYLGDFKRFSLSWHGFSSLR